MDYSGTIEGAFDEISSITGNSYRIENEKNMVTWSAFMTKTFDVSFIPGDANFEVGGSPPSSDDSSSSGSSSSSSSSTSGTDLTEDSQYSRLQGTVSVWKDVQSAIQSLLSDDGKLTVSQATTSITVRDHGTNILAVERYLKKMNRALTRQVRVALKIVEVQLNDTFQFGIDWDLVRSIDSGKGLLSFIAPSYTNTSVSSLGSSQFIWAQSTGRMAGTNTLLNIVQDQGKVSILTEPTLVTLNNQIGQVLIQNQQLYITQVENTLNENTSQNSVETGTVNTGLVFYVLPKVRGEDVILQINGTLSSLLSLDKFNLSTGAISSDNSGSDPAATNGGSNFVQLPEVNTRYINQRAVIHTGDTLILAGFKSLSNTANREKVLYSQALGSQAGLSQNTEIIFLITPTILSTEDEIEEEDIG